MKPNTKTYIFGSGGHGKVVLDILLEAGVKIAGFLDENKNRVGLNVCGYPVLGDWSFLEKPGASLLALGIGNNLIRERIYKRAKKEGFTVISAIHPKAIVSKNVKLGEGVVVMPGAVINTGTIVAAGVVVNTSASVDHDCQLDRFCQIWPGAHLAGTVRIGAFSYVGTGAAVIQNIKIGRQVVIGAGAAVVKDIPNGVTAVGVPAKIIKRR